MNLKHRMPALIRNLTAITMMSVLLAAPSVSNAQDTTSGLVTHWTLDETSSTTVSDSTANNNSGTMTGGLDAGTNSIAGQLGTALNLDGVDDYIIHSNVTSDFTISNPWTLSCWVTLDTLGTKLPVACGLKNSSTDNRIGVGASEDTDGGDDFKISTFGETPGFGPETFTPHNGITSP